MRPFAIATLIASTTAVTFDLAKRDDGAAAQNKGSTHTQGSTVNIVPAAEGRTTQNYVVGECYDQPNNPVTYYASNNQAWIQNNQTDTNWGGGNAAQNNLNSQYENTNWYFDIYDAYFNGSVSIKVDPPAGAQCEYEETQAIPYSYFRIGMMSRTKGRYSRTDYDSNPFYFRLGRFTEGDQYSCQLTPRKMFASLESSNNGYDNLQVWTTSSKLNGEQYELSGSITTTYANENNYFNVLPLATSNTTIEALCPSHFYAATLLKDDEVTMNGTVNATNADINWYFTDAESGWSVTGTFTGTAWDGGAKLDFSSKSITPITTGQAKRVACADCPPEPKSYVGKHKTSIIVGVVVGGMIGLAIIAVASLRLWQWFGKRNYNAARQVDQEDAWAIDDHDRDLKAGPATGLRPISSQQNLIPGYSVDTSYESHRRSHSPDPSGAGLPAYSDHYTPLR